VIEIPEKVPLHDYFDDFDHVCVALETHMTSLVSSANFRPWLSVYDQRRFGSNTLHAATDFTRFIVEIGNEELYKAVIEFLGKKGFVVGYRPGG